MARVNHGVRVRFEIFKRDGFRCVYCGALAADVRLVLDHQIPIARGGLDVPENLVTACEECNAGKSDTLLTETAPDSPREAERRRGRFVYDWPTEEVKREFWRAGPTGPPGDHWRIRHGGTKMNPLTPMEVMIHVHCSGVLPPSPKYHDTLPPEPPPKPRAHSAPSSLFGPPQ
jgi:hypothetical protein